MRPPPGSRFDRRADAASSVASPTSRIVLVDGDGRTLELDTRQLLEDALEAGSFDERRKSREARSSTSERTCRGAST